MVEAVSVFPDGNRLAIEREWVGEAPVAPPTSLAVSRAREAGLGLWALARDDSVLLVNDGGSKA